MISTKTGFGSDTDQRWSRSRSAGVDSGRSLHFRLEPESIF